MFFFLSVLLPFFFSYFYPPFFCFCLCVTLNISFTVGDNFVVGSSSGVEANRWIMPSKIGVLILKSRSAVRNGCEQAMIAEERYGGEYDERSHRQLFREFPSFLMNLQRKLSHTWQACVRVTSVLDISKEIQIESSILVYGLCTISN